MVISYKASTAKPMAATAPTEESTGPKPEAPPVLIAGIMPVDEPLVPPVEFGMVELPVAEADMEAAFGSTTAAYAAQVADAVAIGQSSCSFIVSG